MHAVWRVVYSGSEEARAADLQAADEAGHGAQHPRVGAAAAGVGARRDRVQAPVARPCSTSERSRVDTDTCDIRPSMLA